MRSWDCVCLLKLDDVTLLHLAKSVADGVAGGLCMAEMAELIPADVSRYQLQLFLACFYDIRSHVERPNGVRRRVAIPGEAQISYVMRSRSCSRAQAIALIRMPIEAERAA